MIVGVRAVDLDALPRVGVVEQEYALAARGSVRRLGERIVLTIHHGDRIEDGADGLDTANVVMPRNFRHDHVAGFQSSVVFSGQRDHLEGVAFSRASADHGGQAHGAAQPANWSANVWAIPSTSSSPRIEIRPARSIVYATYRRPDTVATDAVTPSRCSRIHIDMVGLRPGLYPKPLADHVLDRTRTVRSRRRPRGRSVLWGAAG